MVSLIQGSQEVEKRKKKNSVNLNPPWTIQDNDLNILFVYFLEGFKYLNWVWCDRVGGNG